SRRDRRGHLLGPLRALRGRGLTRSLSSPTHTPTHRKDTMTDVREDVPGIGDNAADIDQTKTVTEEPIEPGDAGACPVIHAQPHPTMGSANRTWWPEQLNLKILAKNTAERNPLGADFDYKAAFEALDLDAVKKDIEETITTSQ